MLNKVMWYEPLSVIYIWHRRRELAIRKQQYVSSPILMPMVNIIQITQIHFFSYTFNKSAREPIS